MGKDINRHKDYKKQNEQIGKNKEAGITIITLAVTILIIIILASITINAVLGDNGLLSQAQDAKDLAESTTLETGDKMNSLLQEYMNVMAEDSGGGIEEPEVDTTPPTVTIIEGEITQNSIAISVIANDPESGIASENAYVYYLNGAMYARNNSSSCTFTNLTASTQYTIKVEVYNGVGIKGESSITLSTSNPPTPTVEDSKGEKFDNTTQVEDASGDTVWIPGGFEIAEDSANDADDGIVITDGTNEFVWIPVGDDDLAEMYNTTAGNTKLTGVTTTTSIYSKLRVRSGDSSSYTPGAPNTTNIREPDVLSSYDTDSQYYQSILGYGSTKLMADAMVAEYKATYDSIAKYDGFYIGRYELTGTVSSPTVKKGQTVLASQNWYNLKKACTNVVKTNYAQTTMIYGNQWDEVMDWLVDTGEKTSSQVNSSSTSWGNYGSGSIRTAGYSDSWKANNIYDLAGNCWEWTQEASSTNDRVGRGGNDGIMSSNHPASGRGVVAPTVGYSHVSSRPALYIK